ncbi:MAG: fumarylacetoacetate hydrolase family protein [Thermomicrobia bacterium]|nr:fumarylacetoacetate hydrolase family protein [Thermomicrobia bacterium]MCA1724488.1 fumarylacetoacetate hydrolase family protein [Thermomicrobia bacterium]
MQFVRYLAEDGPRFGVLEEAQVRTATGDPFSGLIPGAVVGTLDSLTLLPPIDPGKIIVVEGTALQRWDPHDDYSDPTSVVGFVPPSAVIGHGAAIVMPESGRELKYNPALAVVIGKRAQRVSRDNVGQYILGVTCASEVFMPYVSRALDQRGLDTFLPLGPVVTLGPLQDHVTIQGRVNGKVQQTVNTKFWNGFGEWTVIAEDFQNITLDPGDIVLIRTVNLDAPDSGDTPVHPGDMIEVEIDGIGVLRNPVVQEGNPSRPVVQEEYPSRPVVQEGHPSRFGWPWHHR